ncbi:MAG: hypothetical protein QY305_11985 [Candidatus Brocadiaceae baterium WH-1]|nr:MAG: hypothetical protein QY305_11985 [Candidatus Jettenia sp. AMX2]
MHREQVSSKKDTWIRAIDIELANHFYRKNEFQKAVIIIRMHLPEEFLRRQPWTNRCFIR